MIKTYLICLIVVFNVQLWAQDAGLEELASSDTSVSNTNTEIKIPKKYTRDKPALMTAPNDSSSFLGDSDNIDPLLPNRESIKEDEEPVLEDIKQVLDAPPVKKPVIKTKPVIKKTKPITKAKRPSGVAKKNKKSKKKSVYPNRSPDDPDIALEKKFNSIYKIYNINPTSPDVWSAATSKQVIREYIVQRGDTLWSISDILFGDPNFWPKIWSLNKQGILNPHFITPNAKIYFYMGDEVSTPTLALGVPAQVVANDAGMNAGTGTGAGKGTGIGTGAADTTDYSPPNQAGAIPDSLPVSRNAEYFNKEVRTEIKMDFGEQPRFDFENTSDIFITDQPIKTEVKILISEATKFRCYEGRILRDIRFIGKLLDDYEVYEALDSFKTTIGKMYVYRAYGTAKPYQRRKLKLYDCNGIISTDLVIIPKEKMNVLKNTKNSLTAKAIVIGGPDVVEQRLFISNQIAYVDFGTNPYTPGQEYKTMSQVTDEINGNFKIIQKYGSFAVVMFTEINDVIEIGDKIILN